MKIENRTRLLKALENSSSAVKRNPANVKSEIAQLQSDNAAAVKVSSDLLSTDKSERVKEIKALVASEGYKVDTEKVSRSIIEELGTIRS